jgi:hypothetical protein
MTSEELKQGVLDSLLRIAERFGVPVVLLGILIWLGREAAIAIHGSVVEPVVQSHVEFLEATKHTMEQQSQTLQELATGQREIQQVLARPANTQGAN